MYEELVSSYEKSINNLKDFDELNKLAIEERNTSFQNELLKNIKGLKELVKKKWDKMFFIKWGRLPWLLYRDSCRCGRYRKSRLGRNVEKNVSKMVCSKKV